MNLPRTAIEDVTPIAAARRNASNRRFLWICLGVTSVSVLMLSVLLLTVLIQGAKHLLGAELVVVPDTTRLVSATLDERAHTAVLVTREPRTQYVPLLEHASSSATVRLDGARILLAENGREREIGIRPGATAASITNNFSSIRVDYDELVTHTIALPAAHGIEGATITVDSATSRVTVTFADGHVEAVGHPGGPIARTHFMGSPSLSAAKRFLTSPPSMTPGNAGFNAPLAGSIGILIVCALTALPIGIGAAIMLEEFRPRKRGPAHTLHRLVQTNVRNLAGVPSVVYGLIGLTAFCRMFGLFGSALQYAPYQRFELTDGRVIIGQLQASEDEVYILNADLLGDVKIERSRLTAVTAWPVESAPITFAGTVELTDDYMFVIRSPDLGEVTLDSWSIENAALVDAGPFPPREFTGTFALGGQSRYLVETPTQGLVEIARNLIADPIRDIDTIPIREHRFTLTDGRTLRGEIIRMDDGRITLRASLASEPFTFESADIATRTNGTPAYAYQRMITFGDEDSMFHIRFPMGASVLAGGLTLMLVVLPIVIIATQESLRAVPDSLRSGAMALGATPWQVVWGTTLPNAVPGIMTGAILAMSRAIGEAAPILVVGGTIFITFLPDNLMSGFAAMPLQIYMWTNQPDPEFKKVAASGIVVLLVVLLAFNAAAVFIRQKLQRPLA